MAFLMNLFKKIIQYILISFFPELYILKNKNYSFSFLNSYGANSEFGENIKLNSIYHIDNSKIDNYTYVSYGSHISFTTIGKFCSIGPNFFCGWGIHPTNGISTSPMFYSAKKQNGLTLSKSDKIVERKRINIGNDVFIGANVTVLDGVSIGDGAIIGAGAVVSKDIPPYAIAVGCPIKILKFRFEENQIEKLLKIKWWDFPEHELNYVEEMFFDIDSFIKKYGSKA